MFQSLFLAAVFLVGPYDSDQFVSRIEVPNGKTVALSASAADSTEWRWTNPPPDANPQVWPDGKMFVLSTGQAGEYVVAEASASIVDSKIKQKLLLHLVKVLPPPGPVPNPNPGPNPNPPTPGPDPLPAGRYGLARVTRDLVQSSFAAGSRGPCDGFSANYSVVASQIAAGAIKGLAAANLALQKRNQETAGSALDAWKTAVFVPLGVRMTELVKAGQLDINKSEDLHDAFSEVSSGFAGAK